VTDQRNRVTTDPGLGPVELEHQSTLRSIVAADPIAADEDPGALVYYEPKPLHAVSDHKTLELETVKLAKDIDPRKLPTELKLRRPVLHVLPASDPNWPAPVAPPEAGWTPPLFDSGWPPPETVLTTSQPPQAARRRSFVPLVLFALLGAAVLIVLGATARRRTAASASAALRAPVATLPAATRPSAIAPKNVGALPNALPLLTSGEAAVAGASAPPAGSVVNAIASATAAETGASAAPARPADPPHHTSQKPIPLPNANSRTLSAPPTAKPKRAIY
jgi:hypothetical protein